MDPKVQEVDNALIPKLLNIPSDYKIEAQSLSAGIATGKIIHASQLEKITSESVLKDKIVIVNGKIPYADMHKYKHIPGVISISPDSAAQQSHFMIGLITNKTAAVLENGEVIRQEDEIVGVRFTDAEGNYDTLDVGEQVTVDALQGAIYKGKGAIQISGARKQILGQKVSRQERKEYEVFKGNLAQMLDDIEEKLGICVNANVYTPEQVVQAWRISEAEINLARSENFLEAPEDRENFQWLFMLRYAQKEMTKSDPEMRIFNPSQIRKPMEDLDCIDDLLEKFRDTQKKKTIEVMDQFYRLAKTGDHDEPYRFQLRFLDASLSEIFCHDAEEVKQFLEESSKNRNRQSREGTPIERIKSSIGKYKGIAEKVLRAFVSSPDYSTGLRGVRLSGAFPEIYKAQASAFLGALDDLTKKHNDFYSVVSPSFVIPYVSTPGEVQRVIDLVTTAGGEDNPHLSNVGLGITLETHMAANYMKGFLGLGVENYMIGTNDLISSWRGQDRQDGLPLDDDETRMGLIRSFSDYIQTIYDGVEAYKAMQTSTENTKLMKNFRLSISGELPASVLSEILTTPQSSILTAIGLPPGKIPHYAATWYTEADDILQSRKEKYS